MSTDQDFDDELMSEMLSDFLDESESYLDHLNENLLAIDELIRQQGDDAAIEVELEVLNAMFRDAHSLKGLSAMLGLNDINRLTHKIENVFDAARNDSLTVSRNVIDVILESVDRLTAMIDELSSDEPQECEYEGVVEALSQILAGPVEEPDEVAATVSECKANNTSVAENRETPSAGNGEGIFEDVQDAENIPEKYVSIFIDETEESLTELMELLESDAPVDVSSLLAISHRVKGSAASIGLNRVARLAHIMEDLIQHLRDNNVQPDEDAVEAFVFTIDRLFDFVHTMNTTGGDASRFDEAYQKLDFALRSLKTEVGEKAEVGDSPMLKEKVNPAGSAHDKIENEPHSVDGALHGFIKTLNLAERESRVVVGAVEFVESLPLVGMKAHLVLERLLETGSMIKSSPDEDVLDDVEELSCFLFAVETEIENDELKSKIQVDGIAQITVIESKAFSGPVNDANAVATVGSQTGASSSSSTTAVNQPRATNSSPTEQAKSDRPIETIRVDIDRLDHLMNQAGQLVINKARFSRIGDQFKLLATRRHTVQSLGNAATLLEKMDACSDSIQNGVKINSHVSTLQSHINELKIELESVTHEIQKFKNIRVLVNDLGEAVHQLDRVSEGIQKSVMDTRMVAIGPLFSRFKRVVRDYTKGSKKEIRLVIKGDKTELDKRMIDELGDPLIHMVRNSADHGIEMPEERIQHDKPRQGTITLDAFHRGNQVFVEVRDDGRGLEPDRLKQKAISKGIISREEAERLSPSQAFQLIWEPGFSTAEQVTEISGRGMGMDIVHSKLEKLNGTVEIDSQLHVGTTITIKLPLTMAILPSLLTVIDDEAYAIPVESVLEIVQVKADQFSTVHGARTALIRGRVVSVIELGQLMAPGHQPVETVVHKDETLVIIGNKGNELGLVVDELLGEEDIVIKSLAENYRNVNGFAGASILGDGRVSLILDVSAIIDMSCNPKPTPSFSILEKKEVSV